MKTLLLIAALLLASPAIAQVKLPKPTGDALRDAKTFIDENKPSATSSSSSSQPFPCDVSLFTKLTPTNVVNAIKNCVGDVIAAGAKPLTDDLTDSLNSAKAANDGTAQACYAPALALAQAAQGSPGTPAVTAADGTVTTPAVPARPAGPILIFQKYREFVNAGGPSNCKTTVQSTINGTVASAL